MRYTLSLKLPILAVCRGMQILNIALGGTIYQDLSLRWPASLNHMQLSADRSDPCHKLTVLEDSILSNILNKNEYVNSFHHQCIRDLGRELPIPIRSSSEYSGIRNVCIMPSPLCRISSMNLSKNQKMLKIYSIFLPDNGHNNPEIS